MKRSGMILLILYGAATLTAVFFHEPWRDELQAWLIARHLPVAGIWHEMRYEGHFALWSLLLKIGTAAGWPVWTMQITAWGAAMAAAWLLIRFAPFRWWENAGILASAGMLYWFPAVARCYALIPPVVFALAAAWPSRREHPWRVAILTALLTQTHAYMEGMAAMIFAVMAVEWWHIPRTDIRQRLRSAGAMAIMAGAALVGLLQVYPAFRVASGANVTPLPDAAAWYARLLKVAVSFADGFCGAAFAGAAAPVVVWLCWLIPLAAVILLAMVSRRAAWIVAGGWLWQIAFAFFLYEYIPQRSALVLVLLVFGVWIGAQERDVPAMRLRRLRAVLAAVCLLTVPFGIGMCAADIRNPYSGVRDVGNFIDGNVPPHLPVLLYPYSDRTVPAAAYAERHRFFALIGGRPAFFYHRAKNDIASVCFAREFMLMALDGPVPDEFLLLTNGDYFPEAGETAPFPCGRFQFQQIYRTPFSPLIADEYFRVYLCRRQ